MKIQKLEESKQDIIDFLRGLKYGDDYDFEPVGEWEVSAWVTNPSMDFPHGAYIVQVNNFDLGKEFYEGDIESQKELEYKIEKMIKNIQSLTEDKEINEDKDKYSKEDCLKALSKMTEEEKWSYIDEEQGMDEQVYDKDGIINRYGADEEDDAWVFNGIESGAKYFVPDYEVCGSFEDIVGDDEMVYDALSDESRKDIVDKYLNESLKESLSPEEAGASGLFNDLIQREYEQLNQYDSVQITLEDQGDDRFSEILEYIKDDLNIHIGMLQSCLDDITGSGEQVDQGESQADQVLGESLVLEESLFNEEQQAFYDYPDELVWTFFDWCAELDPYDFPYSRQEGEDIDGWEMACKQISPDDIMEQVSEEMEYVADDPVNQELIHLGQKVIQMAQEFRDKYIED